MREVEAAHPLIHLALRLLRVLFRLRPQDVFENRVRFLPLGGHCDAHGDFHVLEIGCRVVVHEWGGGQEDVGDAYDLSHLAEVRHLRGTRDEERCVEHADIQDVAGHRSDGYALAEGEGALLCEPSDEAAQGVLQHEDERGADHRNDGDDAGEVRIDLLCDPEDEREVDDEGEHLRRRVADSAMVDVQEHRLADDAFEPDDGDEDEDVEEDVYEHRDALPLLFGLEFVQARLLRGKHGFCGVDALFEDGLLREELGIRARGHEWLGCSRTGGHAFLVEDFFLIEEIKIHIAGIDALAQGRDDGALLFDDAGEVGGVAADCRICLHECRQFVFNLRVNSLALTRDLFFDGILRLFGGKQLLVTRNEPRVVNLRFPLRKAHACEREGEEDGCGEEGG